jgi:hypothetical protein
MVTGVYSPAQRTAWQFRQSCAQRRRRGADEDDDPQAVEHAVAIECAAFSGGVVPGCDIRQGEPLVVLYAAAVREWIAAAPGRVHVVILEELRTRPVAVLSAMCHFMGLETVWSDDEKAREVRAFFQGVRRTWSMEVDLVQRAWGSGGGGHPAAAGRAAANARFTTYARPLYP